MKEAVEVLESKPPSDSPVIFSKELASETKNLGKFQATIEEAASEKEGLKKQLIARDERLQNELANLPENEVDFLSYNPTDQTRSGIERGNAVEPAIAKILEPYGKVTTEIKALDGDGGKRISDVQVKLEKDVIISPGVDCKAGDVLSIEIKAGGENYLQGQLKPGGHAEKQCQGHEGKSILVVTEDFRNLPPETQKEIRDRFRHNGTTIIVALPSSQLLDIAVDKAAVNINRHI